LATAKGFWEFLDIFFGIFGIFGIFEKKKKKKKLTDKYFFHKVDGI
jgi:hypothetical protein